MDPLLHTLQIVALYILWRRTRRNRRFWSRRIFLDRPLYGHGSALLPAMRQNDPELFSNYTRMSNAQFDKLLLMVGDKLKKETTRLRQPISPSDRLSICLRFLATGSSYADLAYSFRCGRSTICEIIKETCKVLIEELMSKYLRMPNTTDEWKDVATGYEHRWNFPHCVGALDGKHIAIQAPPSSGSTFYNYKGFHSIVLMAACDAFYCFTFVEVGSSGRNSDGGVFANSFLGQQMCDNTNFLPPAAVLPTSTKVAPYVFVADEAFPMKINLMRPYPGQYLIPSRRVFNYRLSRARRCIENAFGILTSRWRILRTTMAQSPETAGLVVLACCCLHNFLMKEEMPYANRTYCPTSYADSNSDDATFNPGAWRADGQLTSVQRLGANRSSDSAKNVRETFKQYFNNEGSVSWQNTV